MGVGDSRVCFSVGVRAPALLVEEHHAPLVAEDDQSSRPASGALDFSELQKAPAGTFVRKRRLTSQASRQQLPGARTPLTRPQSANLDAYVSQPEGGDDGEGGETEQALPKTLPEEEAENEEDGLAAAAPSRAARKAATGSAAPGSKATAATVVVMSPRSRRRKRRDLAAEDERMRRATLPAKLVKRPAAPLELKGPIFGVSLDKLEGVALPEYAAPVPAVLVRLREFMDAQGLWAVEGLFRKSPPETQLREAQAQLDRGVFQQTVDPHVLPTLLKRWLAQLPAPLLPPSPALLGCASEEAASALVDAMPEPSRSVMQWVLDLCVRVLQEAAANKMSPQALGVVFAPVVSPVPLDGAADPLAVMQDTKKCAAFFAKAVAARARARGVAVAAAP